ncbi:ubiquinone anaerobic biosynthesis accessory factor UbiT [Ferruginivarius sediminum]|nr:SCP2 sterol-binding domain-containing protein [Ferruginivarius sediminum]
MQANAEVRENVAGIARRITPITPLGWLARPLPVWPVERVLDELARRIVRRNPTLFDRLPLTEAARLRLLPLDLPWQIVIRVAQEGVRVSVLDKQTKSPACDASIEGPLERLVASASGDGDGDAMFFAGDIRVTGDTELILAIRNALDDADVDPAGELAAMTGPFAGMARRLGMMADRIYRNASSGLDLVRADITAPIAARVDAQGREVQRLRTEVERLNRRARRGVGETGS